MGFYLATATVASDGLDYGSSDYVSLYYDSDTGGSLETYGWAPSIDAAANEVFEIDSTQSVLFYLPAEPEDDSYEGETGTDGDRINSGDAVSAFGGVGADPPTAACAEDVKVKLGAATLAAGSFAVLAASLF